MPSSSSSGSHTSVVELQSLPAGSKSIIAPTPTYSPDTRSIHSKNSGKLSIAAVPIVTRHSPSDDFVDRNESLPTPTTAVSEEVIRWNSPRINMYRVLASFWAFIVLGMNDAAVGALIPYLETYYDLQYAVVSLLFLAPFVGYALAAMLNNTVHMTLGQRGIAIISPLCKMAAYLTICLHPPYGVLVVGYFITGFGNGLEDAAWNAYIAPMARANEVLGFLHGFYGLGGVLSPLIATTIVAKANLPWYTFYYVMLGMGAIEFVTSVAAFWKEDGQAYRLKNPRTSAKKQSRLREAAFTMPSARVTWLCAAFLFGYVGVEVSLGGWIVTFMIRVRQGARFASGMTATGFWLGLTVGRMVLGFVTPKIGEKRAIIIYLPLTMAFELLFWLVPQFYVSAVAVGIQGFFLGPLFPATMVVATRLLPRHLHVAALGFSAAIGGGGAAVFPFVVGAIAQAKGVKVLQPIILALLATILLIWLSLPRLSKRRTE